MVGWMARAWIAIVLISLAAYITKLLTFEEIAPFILALFFLSILAILKLSKTA